MVRIYGHPHYEVTSGLQQLVKFYGTVESGHIVIETDVKNYKVNADEWTGIGATSSITLAPMKRGKVEIVYKDNVEERVIIQNNSAEPVALDKAQLINPKGEVVSEFK